MEKLPDELVDLVLDSCDYKSFKNLRLTCKRLERIVVPRIYKHVHCGLFHKSLEKLTGISNHPELSQMVEKFTFHGELLPHYASMKEWQRRIDLRPPFKSFFGQYCKEINLESLEDEEKKREGRTAALAVYEHLPRRTHSKEELGACWSNYQKYQKDQESWDPPTSRTFRNAISRLPNLTDVKMSTGTFGEVKNYGPVWGGLMKEILQGPKDWRYIPPRAYGNLRSQTHTRMEGVRQLTDLLEAICVRKSSNPSKQIQSLEFLTTNDVFWKQRPPEIVDPYSLEVVDITIEGAYPRIYAMKSAFEHVKRLHMTVSFLDSEDEVPPIANGMRAFLHAARALEDLHFDWTEENLVGLVETERVWDPLEVLGDVHWPNLKTLFLSFATTEENLIRLFKSHAATLRSLSLQDMFIVENRGTWKSVIDQIPHVLKLNSISLEALWDYTWENRTACLFERYEGGAYELSIINYCLHGGEPPIIYPEEWNKLHPDQPAPTADPMGHDWAGDDDDDGLDDDGYDDSDDDLDDDMELNEDEEEGISDDGDSEWEDEDEDAEIQQWIDPYEIITAFRNRMLLQEETWQSSRAVAE